jgi:hypothetical protein
VSQKCGSGKLRAGDTRNGADLVMAAPKQKILPHRTMDVTHCRP